MTNCRVLFLHEVLRGFLPIVIVFLQFTHFDTRLKVHRPTRIHVEFGRRFIPNERGPGDECETQVRFMLAVAQRAEGIRLCISESSHASMA